MANITHSTVDYSAIVPEASDTFVSEREATIDGGKLRVGRIYFLKNLSERDGLNTLRF